MLNNAAGVEWCWICVESVLNSCWTYSYSYSYSASIIHHQQKQLGAYYNDTQNNKDTDTNKYYSSEK